MLLEKIISPIFFTSMGSTFVTVETSGNKHSQYLAAFVGRQVGSLTENNPDFPTKFFSKKYLAIHFLILH